MMQRFLMINILHADRATGPLMLTKFGSHMLFLFMHTHCVNRKNQKQTQKEMSGQIN